MAIDWYAGQREGVVAHLSAHPAESGECLEAARAVLPIAKARDPNAHSWKLVPIEGRFVVPKRPLERRWFHHYTVEAVEHCVDALVGADGSPRSGYLEQHWQYADCISLQEVDLAKEET